MYARTSRRCMISAMRPVRASSVNTSGRATYPSRWKAARWAVLGSARRKGDCMTDAPFRTIGDSHVRCHHPRCRHGDGGFAHPLSPPSIYARRPVPPHVRPMAIVIARASTPCSRNRRSCQLASCSCRPTPEKPDKTARAHLTFWSAAHGGFVRLIRCKALDTVGLRPELVPVVLVGEVLAPRRRPDRSRARRRCRRGYRAACRCAPRCCDGGRRRSRCRSRAPHFRTALKVPSVPPA